MTQVTSKKTENTFFAKKFSLAKLLVYLPTPKASFLSLHQSLYGCELRTLVLAIVKLGNGLGYCRCVADLVGHVVEVSKRPFRGLNLAFGLVTSSCSRQTACWRHSCCGWGEGTWALVTRVKAIRVGVGFKKVTLSAYKIILFWFFFLRSFISSAKIKFRYLPKPKKVCPSHLSWKHVFSYFSAAKYLTSKLETW